MRTLLADSMTAQELFLHGCKAVLRWRFWYYSGKSFVYVSVDSQETRGEAASFGRIG